MKKHGFTLSELIAVIAIIGIIILIAVPSIIAIYKNMNKRIYNNKKETITVAAELYANNNPELFNGRTEVELYVSELLNSNYITADQNDSSSCSESGCIINPIDKTSMNGDCVVLKKESVGVSATYYPGCTNIDSQIIEGTLVEQVCKKFNNGTFAGVWKKEKNDNDEVVFHYCKCKFNNDNVIGVYDIGTSKDNEINIDSQNVNACLISGDDVNNYLRYDNVMWRVVGVYDIYNNQSKLVAKIVTNDTVDN